MPGDVPPPQWIRPQYLKPKIAQDTFVFLATSKVESNTTSLPSRMATFNFKKYLSNIDPENDYTIHALSGGRVNLTVRAIKAPCTDIDAGRFPGHESIVLKYAPAFIAKDGEAAPFSTFRQVSVLSHTYGLPLSKALICSPRLLKRVPLACSPLLMAS